MRFRHYFVVQDSAGNAVDGASVSVYLAGTNTPAVVYPTRTSSQGTSTVPQLYSRENGSVVFWLDSNDYNYGQLFDIVVQKGTFSWTLNDVEIIVWDVVNASRLGGYDSSYYLNRANHTGTQPPSTISPQGHGSGLNADTLDGFHASQTPAPNTILPLNANGRIYNYVAYGSLAFDPPDFTISNGTEYFVGSVSITTPSWSPSGAWKVIFVVTSNFHSEGAGINNFQYLVKFGTTVIGGTFWFWNASGANYTIGVSDTFIMPDLGNGVSQSYDFYVFQGGGNANAVFEWMKVNWYLIPA